MNNLHLELMPLESYVRFNFAIFACIDIALTFSYNFNIGGGRDLIPGTDHKLSQELIEEAKDIEILF